MSQENVERVRRGYEHLSRTGEFSGIEIEAQFAHLWTIRNDKGVRVRVLDRETAIEAAGLRE